MKIVKNGPTVNVKRSLPAKDGRVESVEVWLSGRPASWATPTDEVNGDSGFATAKLDLCSDPDNPWLQIKCYEAATRGGRVKSSKETFITLHGEAVREIAAMFRSLPRGPK